MCVCFVWFFMGKQPQTLLQKRDAAIQLQHPVVLGVVFTTYLVEMAAFLSALLTVPVFYLGLNRYREVFRPFLIQNVFFAQEKVARKLKGHKRT